MKREDQTTPEKEPQWRKISFSDCFEFLSNNSLSRDKLSLEENGILDIHYGDVLLKYGSSLDTEQENIPGIIDKELVKLNEKTLLKDGDLIISDTAEDETAGKTTEISNVGDKKVVSGLHTIPVRPLKENLFIPGYLGYYMNSEMYRKQLYPLMHGVKVISISKKDISKTWIEYPDKSTQSKIVQIFRSIDSKILQESRRLEKLKLLKIEVLRQIFSQKLRFKDENGNEFPEWKLQKIGTYLTIKDIRQEESLATPLMAFIANKGIQPKGDRYDRSFLIKTDHKKYKRTDFNDFIYSSNNLDVGSIGLNKYGSSVISVVYEVFEIKDKGVPDFISEYFRWRPNILKFLKFRQGCLYGQYKIPREDFIGIELEFPCFEEQQKISEFIKALNEKIKIAETKLSEWELTKKGLLQQLLPN